MTGIMRPTTVVLLLAVFIGMTAAAQDTGEEPRGDVVLLSNGASIYGHIIKNEPGKELQIERVDGEVFTVPYDRIAAVTDEDKLDEHYQALKESEPPYKRPLKWVNITQVGLLTGEGLDMLAVSTYNGVMLNPNVFLGAGLGWMNFPSKQGSSDPGDDMVPITGDIRFFTEIGRFQPYVDVSPGYSIGLGRSGGITVGLAAGTKLKVAGAAPLLQVGYVMQGYEVAGNRETLSFFSAMAGIMF